ncbi:basic salivary proline-rich protein 1-like isoform X1 [Antechinus flavipes]|uniref:basic salivary proline-rich protein 1-like isoform X1 n=1 Tax=Antechinus flavipes TaxID=38775 RepID=UPI0022369604|nr:basic salivary proline-rich protein 1-like isoform X1 [Antechinus flavipes]
MGRAQGLETPEFKRRQCDPAQGPSSLLSFQVKHLCQRSPREAGSTRSRRAGPTDPQATRGCARSRDPLPPGRQPGTPEQAAAPNPKCPGRMQKSLKNKKRCRYGSLLCAREASRYGSSQQSCQSYGHSPGRSRSPPAAPGGTQSHGARRPPRAVPRVTEPAGRPRQHSESRSPPAAPGGTPSHGASRPPQAALRVTEPAGRPGRHPESRSQPAAPGSTPSH